jgi:hypothetical protein
MLFVPPNNAPCIISPQSSTPGAWMTSFSQTNLILIPRFYLTSLCLGTFFRIPRAQSIYFPRNHRPSSCLEQEPGSRCLSCQLLNPVRVLATRSLLTGFIHSGAVICVGGPALVQSIRPTDEELFKRYNPELQKRSLEEGDRRAQEFDDYVNRLKQWSKSDKSSMWS